MLVKALKVEKGDMVVFVGAGGKTSAMKRLAKDLYALGETVIITTTTKIYPIDGPEYQLSLVGDSEVSSIIDSILWERPKIIILGKEINQEGKIVGLDSGRINGIRSILKDLTILVEGDGAKGKPFKAPRDFEPVIPSRATMVVPVIGIDAIGQSLSETNFHGLENICLLTGLKPGEIFLAKDAAAVLLGKDGYQKEVPQFARWIPLINKVDNLHDRENALELAGILKSSGVEKVILASLKNENKLVEVF
ncbi:MAG: selenium cofactor biosynthesis protein YqeC [Dehalobacterium sp.]